MTACEDCWNEACRQVRMLGGRQVDHYRRLIQVVHNGTTVEPPPETQETATTSAAERTYSSGLPAAPSQPTAGTSDTEAGG